MMTRKQNKPNRVRQNKPASSETNQLLKSLLEVNKRQTLRDEPTVPDIPRLLLKRNKVYTFTDVIIGSPVTLSSTVPVNPTYAFSMSILPNANDYTNLFDQYRIIQVSAEFNPQSVTTIANSPPIYSVIDYDDSNTVTALQIAQYDSCMACPAGVFFERTFAPMPSIDAFNGVITGGFASGPRGLWIDVASPGVSYFGLKLFIDVGSANAILYNPTFHVTLQCRNTR
jgi:hypothetical protein